MSSQITSDSLYQHALLKIFKSLSGMPAQFVFYGSALLAIAAIGGTDFTGGLAILANGVGVNILSSILERISGGVDIPEEEIRKAVEDAIKNSGIEKQCTRDSRDIERAIAHMFRQFDLLRYAINKGESNTLTLINEKFADHNLILQELKLGLASVYDQNKEILNTVKDIAETQKVKIPTSLIDQKIIQDLNILRRARHFNEFDRIGFSLTLASGLLEGEYSGGSDPVKSNALAWCSRVLSYSEEVDKAEEFLGIAKRLGTDPNIEIAMAFINSQKGNKNAALRTLVSINLPQAKSAALTIVAHHDGPKAALDWVKAADITNSDLDSDGKQVLLAYLLSLDRWEDAQACLNTLNNEDLRESPSIHHLVALTHLICAVPHDLRPFVLNGIPMDAANFPLSSNKAAIEACRISQTHFIEAASVARQYNCPNTAILCEDYALWLEIKDPETFNKGIEKLEDKLRDIKSALRYVHLGLQFGLKMDLEMVESGIEREILLYGGMTQNAAFARFALACTQKTPENVANYLARYRDDLEMFFDRKLLRLFEIDVLAQAGKIEKANECINLLIGEGISEVDETRLRRLIAESEGTDAVFSRKEQFKATDSLEDLAILVSELENRNDWESLCEYRSIMYKRTHALSDAVRLANVLNNSKKTDQLVNFIKANPDLLSQSKELQILYCWALYNEGALVEARSEFGKLSDLRDDPNYRALQINLGIALGDWNSLLEFIAIERLEKDKRSAQDLISTAQLALLLEPSVAKELIFTATDKGKDDANILTTAYGLATAADWEDNPEVFRWLERAAILSGEDGPIQKKTLKEILDMKPEWDQRVSETWNLLNHGEIPLFVAAHCLNKSLIEMILFPAYANPFEGDPRRRGVVPAYSGKLQRLPIDARGKVAIETTALITLSYLNLLDKALDSFDTIYIPHATLIWLFEEKRKATFHQPSRIRSAHQIRDLLATDTLEKLHSSATCDSELSNQVGDELATLIAEAEKVRENDDAQRIVVRPSPVFRVSLMMEEEADLSSHAVVLSSCQAIVDKLQQRGQITAEEGRKAHAYLQIHEKPWPTQPEIRDGAILYLDELSITYFLHIGILNKLRAAGFRPIASPWKVSETNDLIAYERISGKINEAIEYIRSSLNARIETGKIRMGRQRIVDEPEKQSLFENPTASILTLAHSCDIVIADDRFLNQHAVIDDNGTQVPIFTTLDLIDALVSSGSISPEERLEYRTSLRRAGYFFVPISEEELAIHLNASHLKDNKVLEIAELKAIRENFLQVRMSNWLQLPNELLWFDMSLKAFIQTLKSLWAVDADLSSARIRSDWILDQLDVRGWAHSFGKESGDNLVKIGRAAYILMVITPPLDAPQDIKEDYWNWVEDRILIPVQEQFPDLYSWIVEWYRNTITDLSNRYPKGWGQHDEHTRH